MFSLFQMALDKKLALLIIGLPQSGPISIFSFLNKASLFMTGLRQLSQSFTLGFALSLAFANCWPFLKCEPLSSSLDYLVLHTQWVPSRPAVFCPLCCVVPWAYLALNIVHWAPCQSCLKPIGPPVSSAPHSLGLLLVLPWVHWALRGGHIAPCATPMHHLYN